MVWTNLPPLILSLENSNFDSWHKSNEGITDITSTWWIIMEIWTDRLWTKWASKWNFRWQWCLGNKVLIKDFWLKRLYAIYCTQEVTKSVLVKMKIKVILVTSWMRVVKRTFLQHNLVTCNGSQEVFSNVHWPWLDINSGMDIVDVLQKFSDMTATQDIMHTEKDKMYAADV